MVGIAPNQGAYPDANADADEDEFEGIDLITAIDEARMKYE